MSQQVDFQKYEAELINLRRYFHQHPELANEEYQTSEYVAKFLTECRIEVRQGLAQTGVLGILEGKGGPGPTIGIRTELDALPINEENTYSYRSRHPYKMHACGHDGHMAVTLMTAKILASVRAELKGKIVFIFQPAEENLPEGGAKRLIKEGHDIFANIDEIYGFHFWPALETGKVSVPDVPMMAAGDIFEVNFAGRGAHAANPHQSSDVLMMTSNAVLSLTSIIARNIEPEVLATLSVSVIEGGKSPNVLPAEAKIKGTARYLSEDLKDVFPEKIDTVLEGISRAYNGIYKLNYMYGYPVLQNHKEKVKFVKKCAGEVLNASNLTNLINPSLASEDFAVYLQNIPGCYFWVGTNNQSENVVNYLHNPKFDLDEAALMIAVKILFKICQKS